MKGLKKTVVFDTFWKFIEERQAVFYRRAQGSPSPWTNDPIIAKYKFTNVYRASDRVSQYLIKNVIYKGEQNAKEIFFRTILFKIFNRIETWDLLLNSLGEISYKEYSYKHYDKILSKARSQKQKLYSAAYIMPSGKTSFGFSEKHRNNLKLLEMMMKEDLPTQISASKSMEEAYKLILEYPTMGPFLAYQYIVDLNYSDFIDFSEMEFVVAGPGARDGIDKCFSDRGNYSDSDIIKHMAENQENELLKRNAQFSGLWGRQMQLIDCQNVFCEVAKYARVAHPQFSGITGRTRIKQSFHPDKQQIDYFFPPKWGINKNISSTQKTTKFGKELISEKGVFV